MFNLIVDAVRKQKPPATESKIGGIIASWLHQSNLRLARELVECKIIIFLKYKPCSFKSPTASMILSDPLLFSLALLDTGAILFLLIYFIITISDLECDYLNAQQCCSKLNPWVIPKLIAHIFITVVFILHGHWILCFINIPMVVWLGYEVAHMPSGNLGVYDPTEIHNRGQLKRHMRDCMIYLGYYLVFFFIYLYGMIVSLLKGDPINRKDEGEIEF
ncbi:hypothetical protein RN001_002688 [Aquatica leii]|uniref:Protein cornichon homolog 4 n=1 Tax=Aquatica leii TaxID=1421715 RepID=A0AAN7Q8V3_9COLE|nr:hypothetical protein RN001_002688 [Aquatica leii]